MVPSNLYYSLATTNENKHSGFLAGQEITKMIKRHRIFVTLTCFYSFQSTHLKIWSICTIS